MNTKEEMNKEKIEFLYEQKLMAHLKVGKYIYNGIIDSIIDDRAFYIIDRVIGKKLFFFKEITDADEYNETNKENNNSSAI